MKVRVLMVFALLAMLTSAGCIVKRERVVYRPTSHTHSGSGGSMPADPDRTYDPRPAPGTLGDDDDDSWGHEHHASSSGGSTTVVIVTEDRDEPAAGPQGNPPAHAPAHGLRRQQRTYYYYPAWQVYYAPYRKVYFWLEGDAWKVGAVLPKRFQLKVKERVLVKLDTDKPFEQHEQVLKKHGPKHSKKGHEAGGKGSGHHDDGR